MVKKSLSKSWKTNELNLTDLDLTKKEDRAKMRERLDRCDLATDSVQLELDFKDCESGINNLKNLRDILIENEDKTVATEDVKIGRERGSGSSFRQHFTKENLEELRVLIENEEKKLKQEPVSLPNLNLSGPQAIKSQKLAEELNKLIVNGLVKVSDFPLLIEAGLDSNTVEAWKIKYQGQPGQQSAPTNNIYFNGTGGAFSEPTKQVKKPIKKPRQTKHKTKCSACCNGRHETGEIVVAAAVVPEAANYPTPGTPNTQPDINACVPLIAEGQMPQPKSVPEEGTSGGVGLEPLSSLKSSLSDMAQSVYEATIASQKQEDLEFLQGINQTKLTIPSDFDPNNLEQIKKLMDNFWSQVKFAISKNSAQRNSIVNSMFEYIYCDDLDKAKISIRSLEINKEQKLSIKHLVDQANAEFNKSPVLAPFVSSWDVCDNTRISDAVLGLDDFRHNIVTKTNEAVKKKENEDTVEKFKELAKQQRIKAQQRIVSGEIGSFRRAELNSEQSARYRDELNKMLDAKTNNI